MVLTKERTIATLKPLVNDDWRWKRLMETVDDLPEPTVLTQEMASRSEAVPDGWLWLTSGMRKDQLESNPQFLDQGKIVVGQGGGDVFRTGGSWNTDTTGLVNVETLESDAGVQVVVVAPLEYLVEQGVEAFGPVFIHEGEFQLVSPPEQIHITGKLEAEFTRYYVVPKQYLQEYCGLMNAQPIVPRQVEPIHREITSV